MAFKYTALIVCTIAISCNGQSSHQYRRSTYQDNFMHGRLSNYPSNQAQTQTIFYPGSAGDLPRYEQPAPSTFSLPLPTPDATSTTTTSTTTTTTPYPGIYETIRSSPRRPIAPIAPIVSPTVPAASIRAPARRRRPQSNVVENRSGNRFENSKIENNEPLTEDDEEARLYREEQARNAHYSFGTSIDDTINDHSIHRQETREGLALKGMYSYSDGFFKRTIHYEADENGYRVVKEEIEPIGEGPQYNPDGRADVSTSLHGSQNKYTITADDFVRARDTPTHRFSQRV